MTWEINTSGSYADNTTASAKAGKFVEAFVETVAEHDGISANLPFYIRSLPYYQRLLATALASSLQSSMPKNSAAVEVLLTNAREWILPPPAT
jgi:hypothetical protein